MGTPIGQATSLGVILDANNERFAKAFSDETPTLDLFRRISAKDVKLNGNVYEFPVYLQKAYNFGARAPGRTLPGENRLVGATRVRDDGRWETAQVAPAHLWARIMLDGDVIAAYKSNPARFVNAITLKKKLAKQGLARFCEFELHGDGTGAFGRVAAVAAIGATQFTVRLPTNFANEGEWGTYWLRAGMFVVSVDPVTRAVRGGVGYRIRAVDPATGTVTIDRGLAAALAVDDLVCEGDDAGNGAFDSLDGLYSWIGTSEDAVRYLGISRDEHERWEATILNVAAAAIGDMTPYHLRLAGRRARDRAEVKPGTKYRVLMHSALWDEIAYGARTGGGQGGAAAEGIDLNANRRFLTDKVKAGIAEFEMGDPSLGGFTIVELPTARPNRTIGIPDDNETVQTLVVQDWKWSEGYAGDGTFTLEPDTDQYVSRISFRGNRFCRMPAACFGLFGARNREDQAFGAL